MQGVLAVGFRQGYPGRPGVALDKPEAPVLIQGQVDAQLPAGAVPALDQAIDPLHQADNLFPQPLQEGRFEMQGCTKKIFKGEAPGMGGNGGLLMAHAHGYAHQLQLPPAVALHLRPQVHRSAVKSHQLHGLLDDILPVLKKVPDLSCQLLPPHPASLQPSLAMAKLVQPVAAAEDLDHLPPPAPQAGF